MPLSTSIKGAIKGVMQGTGAVGVATHLVRPDVVILRYHSIQPSCDGERGAMVRGLVHPLSVFSAQMETLAHHYNPVTVEDIFTYLCEGREIPRRSVAVTFDDGYEDNYELAAPVLHRLGIRASFYIMVSSIGGSTSPWYRRLDHAFATTSKKTWADSTENCKRELADYPSRKAAFLIASRRCACLCGEMQSGAVRTIEDELEVAPLTKQQCPMMNSEQLQELQRAGHIIGSHTVSHPNLAQIGNDDLHREVIESKLQLERLLDAPVTHFSYPSPILQPHYTEETITATKKAGYRTAVTCTSGPVRAGHNPLQLTRITVPFELKEFRWVVDCTLIGRRV